MANSDVEPRDIVQSGDPPDVRGARDALQDRIGYRFRQPKLLAGALTHPSAPVAARAVWRGFGYERLEFLG
ncbi:MAG: hypothetical protein RIM80_12280, partial [Alphaproteobacteria bacterium]